MKAEILIEWEHEGKTYRLSRLGHTSPAYEDEFAVEVRGEDLLGIGRWDVAARWATKSPDGDRNDDQRVWLVAAIKSAIKIKTAADLEVVKAETQRRAAEQRVTTLGTMVNTRDQEIETLRATVAQLHVQLQQAAVAGHQLQIYRDSLEKIADRVLNTDTVKALARKALDTHAEPTPVDPESYNFTSGRGEPHGHP